MKTKTLYRPIGIKEYQLIKASDYKSFPPRLEWQPIFYPVLNQAYAEEICYKWNVNDEFSCYCGLVTKFEVEYSMYLKYPIKNVGGTVHDELWVPSNELEEFNSAIDGQIEIVNAFFGKSYRPDSHPELNVYYTKFQ